ncbi:MAG: hypothetical protein GY863_14725 [bacterium]|nr:hypothetical protein [bacterium]
MSLDPRTIDNEGQGILIIPFNIENASTTPSLDESDIGNPAALTDNNEVSDGADGEVFLGKLIGVSEDGTVAFVQVGGICSDLPYSGTAPVIGWPVQMAGDGVVDKGVTEGVRRGITLSVDTTASTCDILL